MKIKGSLKFVKTLHDANFHLDFFTANNMQRKPITNPGVVSFTI